MLTWSRTCQTLKGKALEEKELGNTHFKNAEYEEALGR